MTIDQLEVEALKLSDHDRERLAQCLIASLDGEVNLIRAWYDDTEMGLLDLLAEENDWTPAIEPIERSWESDE